MRLSFQLTLGCVSLTVKKTRTNVSTIYLLSLEKNMKIFAHLKIRSFVFLLLLHCKIPFLKKCVHMREYGHTCRPGDNLGCWFFPYACLRWDLLLFCLWTSRILLALSCRCAVGVAGLWPLPHLALHGIWGSELLFTGLHSKPATDLSP